MIRPVNTCKVSSFSVSPSQNFSLSFLVFELRFPHSQSAYEYVSIFCTNFFTNVTNIITSTSLQADSVHLLQNQFLLCVIKSSIIQLRKSCWNMLKMWECAKPPINLVFGQQSQYCFDLLFHAFIFFLQYGLVHLNLFKLSQDLCKCDSLWCWWHVIVLDWWYGGID